ncbi:hypothetical protein BJ742DRAFT_742728 [Cladochytrium replicatum]|nr:hypothetical protein BJ742DRAFT_742728 [Cladochytrium replicatum]
MIWILTSSGFCQVYNCLPKGNLGRADIKNCPHSRFQSGEELWTYDVHRDGFLQIDTSESAVWKAKTGEKFWQNIEVVEVRLRCSNGKYVLPDRHNGNAISTTDKESTWTNLKIVQVEPHCFAFKAFHSNLAFETYLCANPDLGTISGTRDLTGWVRFTIVPFGANSRKFALKTFHGTYLCLSDSGDSCWACRVGIVWSDTFCLTSTVLGRDAFLDYAASKKIPVTQTKAKPWSTDENMYHISFEAGILEDPATTPPKDMWELTVDPEDAPNTPERISITFAKGVPTKLENHNTKSTHTDPLDIFLQLSAHGIGRIDIVENRFVGIKSRGFYETPSTILRAAHVDPRAGLRDANAQKLSEIIYNGFWYSPEREFLMAGVEASQATVNGTAKLKLYKGSVIVEGRTSPASLYDADIASMDEAGGFNPADSTGFIKINSIRLKGRVAEERPWVSEPVHYSVLSKILRDLIGSNNVQLKRMLNKVQNISMFICHRSLPRRYLEAFE